MCNKWSLCPSEVALSDRSVSRSVCLGRAPMLSLPVIPHSLSLAHSRPLCLARPLLLFLDPQKPLLLHPDKMCCCYKQVVDAYGLRRSCCPSFVCTTYDRWPQSFSTVAFVHGAPFLSGIIHTSCWSWNSSKSVAEWLYDSAWRNFRLASWSTIVVLSPAGRSSSSVDGRVVLARLPKRSCAGLLFMSCDGVLRWASKPIPSVATRLLRLSHDIFYSFYCTFCKAVGLRIVRTRCAVLKVPVVRKLLECCNWGPLSVLNLSGMPWRANWRFSK